MENNFVNSVPRKYQHTSVRLTEGVKIPAIRYAVYLGIPLNALITLALQEYVSKNAPVVLLGGGRHATA